MTPPLMMVRVVARRCPFPGFLAISVQAFPPMFLLQSRWGGAGKKAGADMRCTLDGMVTTATSEDS
eukprot:CAMPEP_0204566984 /NCGR_PEP_ID=MMETSP0661-20131031/36348_1 /ASSEMBLY_ACC=CAM_ASM_000606 /TAXON_ID=109239 /ORGANISM="Alexandrium margalefi, Strain AMGDE01CS-322" /LENGTH=65 /DNA_ID=CAMNT_0051574861 /DNA_START=58 /DNA_END=251 /DNA_ORIENTATION=+